jgi:hypothetical protein
VILLNREIVSVINIDPDLVATYKRSCDRYLINIHRNLTRQLVDYVVYYHYQQMMNMFGEIINNLIDGLYEDIDDFYTDKEELAKRISVFRKSMEGTITDSVYETLVKFTDMFEREMNKLYYVIENVCYVAEG